MFRAKILFPVILWLNVLPLIATGQEMTVDYVSRYICQSGEPDHLLDAIGVSGNRVVVAGNRGLALLDINALPPEGTRDYLYRLTGLNARNLYLKDDIYLYVNLNRNGNGGSPGFAVVKIVQNTLQHIINVDQSNTLFEKMCIDGDYLYVSAHSKGIRIYNLNNPENPVLMGSLEDGFTDAWAITVSGDTAYVADGAGGLKIVNVTDKTNPFIIDGENLETATGTSEDVTVRDGVVYVAAGGAGVAVYEDASISNRVNIDIGVCAKDMCWVGDYLAVANIGGFVVLDVDDPGQVEIVASEIAARRGPNGTLRICSAVGSADSNLVLVSNWNCMDVYELKTANVSTQPDINCTHQRIRFSPNGGSQNVSIFNNGQENLIVSNVSPSQNSFSVNWNGGTLFPGDSVSFDVSYNGGYGSGVIRIYSNDPDENPLPIQVFGNTNYLDPGDPAVDFTFPLLTKDHQSGGYIEESFTLSDYRGKLVWFQIYGSW